MNKIDKFLLNFYLTFLRLLKIKNLDFYQLKLILQTKLLMDNRRTPALNRGRRKVEKENNSTSAMTIISSFVVGLFLLISFAVGKDLAVNLTVFFSMFIFMLAATLISDFTSVLIDVRDNLIILPKPVNSRTVVTARLTHIAIHITKITLPMVIPSLVAVVRLSGFRPFLPFLLMVFLAMLFSIFLINAIYLLILKITTPSKFQSIITYFQIGFAIFIYAFYQLFFKLIDSSLLSGIDLADYYMLRFIPSFWYAKATVFLYTFELTSLNIICFSLAIAGSLSSIYLVIKYFAPSFNQKLALIGTSGDQGERGYIDKQKKKESGILNRISQLISKDNIERAGFLFTYRMMARSREFKLKVFPSIGYWIVIFVVMIYKSSNESVSDLANLDSKGKSALLLLIYLSSILPSSVFANIAYSSKNQASWIFFASPMKNPGNFLAGALKAIIVYFYLPVTLLLSIVSLIVFGFHIMPNLILALCNVLIIYLLMAIIWFNHFPFSMPIIHGNPKMFLILIVITVTLLLGYFHFYLIFNNLLIVCISIPVVLSLGYFLFSIIRKKSWADIAG
jgi:ABC-2 type transport system permease protein